MVNNFEIFDQSGGGNGDKDTVKPDQEVIKPPPAVGDDRRNPGRVSPRDKRGPSKRGERPGKTIHHNPRSPRP